MRILAAIGAVLLVGLIWACGSGAADGKRTVTVFAAASLTESFGTLERRFEAEHPGVDVALVLGGSSKLAAQLAEGARADVFASADRQNLDKAVRAGRIDGAPATFATNRPAIVVEPGNPMSIDGLGDLANEELTVVVCAPEVPCGAAAGKLAGLAGVRLAPDSEEPDVKSVLNKVRAGEADAGLVYLTDAVAAEGAVQTVELPDAGQAINEYPIALLTEAPEPRLGRQFVELVRSDAGRRVLDRAGFGAP